MDREEAEEAGRSRKKAETGNEPLGRAASPGEKGQEIPANDFILDDATTLLAALRLGIEPPETKIPTQDRLQSLLQSANLIKRIYSTTGTSKTFLESPRADALTMLQDAWVESDSFNEFRLDARRLSVKANGKISHRKHVNSC